MSVQARGSRWDFLRPWPWHYYARVSGIFFVLGGAIELIMIKGGFCTPHHPEPGREYLTLSADEHAMKGAARDAEFNRDLARQMLALHEERLRQKNAPPQDTPVNS